MRRCDARHGLFEFFMSDCQPRRRREVHQLMHANRPVAARNAAIASVRDASNEAPIDGAR